LELRVVEDQVEEELVVEDQVDPLGPGTAGTANTGGGGGGSGVNIYLLQDKVIQERPADRESLF
jgi:hypothetical protein